MLGEEQGRHCIQAVHIQQGSSQDFAVQQAERLGCKRSIVHETPDVRQELKQVVSHLRRSSAIE